MTASLMAGPAWGWGRLGHRVAGRIAEERLTPAAKAAVRGLLEPGESLADISTWADDYRRDHRETGPWHYANVPITEPKFDVRFIPPEGCVVTKVDEFRKILADPSTGRESRVQALKFLTHFVQDMHQPVHVGHRDDRGGNNLQVQFFEEGSNLHAVWDSGLLERPGRDEPTYFALLSRTITPELADAWSAGTTVDWANESLDLARRAYRDPASGAEMRSGARLGQPYQDANLPMAERRVAQAGVRLAWILNGIYK
jgi:hypothetical protein